MPEFENQDSLETVIEDAINDATAEDVTDDAVDTPTDTPADESPADDQESSQAIETPANKQDEAAPGEDDFDKKFGINPSSITGRENRIPYSRVKKIVQKAEKDTETRLRKELEGQSAPKLVEYETKVKDYEGRLERVAQFEHILQNDPKTFLGMLSQVPAYKEFFEFIAQAAAAADKQPTQAEQAILDHSDMPQPDQELSDGSRVYSLEGLAKRDEWLARKIEQRAIQQAEDRLSKRYAPIEQAWQSQVQMNKIVPVVEQQIAEARTWDKFNDLEPRIVAILKADQRISLEKAYLMAYQEDRAAEREKLTTDRNKIRTELLTEIKKAPTKAGSPAATIKPTAKPINQGPRDLEDVIRQSLEDAGLL
jgi:hypothetical protein